MPTIYDIAKRAGVSVATVSKVMNGYPDVSERTRKRIIDITNEMGYHPNASARGLATKRSMCIGVFFKDHVNSGFRHPFFHDVLASFKDVVGANGYDLIFFTNSTATNMDYESQAHQRGVDGLLLAGVPRTDPALVPLSKSSIPCMSIDLDLLGSRAGYLSSDNIQGAEQAVDYLVSCGHQEIAFVGDQFDTRPGHDRMLGYHQGLSRHGLPFRPEWVLEGDFTEVGGYTAMQRILELEHRPTAVFFAGDMMAIGAMKAMRDLGLEPGKDMSMIGFDDVTLASYVTPALTTIRQNREMMGRLAAQELVELIEKPDYAPRVITVQTELVVRQSVVKREALLHSPLA